MYIVRVVDDVISFELLMVDEVVAEDELDEAVTEYKLVLIELDMLVAKGEMVVEDRGVIPTSHIRTLLSIDALNRNPSLSAHGHNA